MAIDTKDSMWVTGRNIKGQLVNPPTNTYTIIPNFLNASVRVVKVALGEEHSIFADSHGKAWSMGGGSFVQLGTGSAADQHAPHFLGLMKGEAIVDVAAGAFSSAFVTLDRRIWVCGGRQTVNVADKKHSIKKEHQEISTTQIIEK